VEKVRTGATLNLRLGIKLRAPGDAGVGASSNQGSSPYQDRERPEEAERG